MTTRRTFFRSLTALVAGAPFLALARKVTGQTVETTPPMGLSVIRRQFQLEQHYDSSVTHIPFVHPNDTEMVLTAAWLAEVVNSLVRQGARRFTFQWWNPSPGMARPYIAIISERGIEKTHSETREGDARSHGDSSQYLDRLPEDDHSESVEQHLYRL